MSSGVAPAGKFGLGALLVAILGAEASEEMGIKGSNRGQRWAGRAASAALAACALALPASSAGAAPIENETAVFAALDKVTGRIQHLEIPIDQTVEFGALRVTPRICNSRPLTEKPDTASFVEVDEVKLTGEQQRIFTGWMFAESPGLHAVEHPVFDVWLTKCKDPIGGPPPESAETESEEAPEEAAAAEQAPAPAPPPQAAQPSRPAAPPPAARQQQRPLLPWLQR